MEVLQIAVGLADIIYHLVAAVALVIGGGWAYLQYIRGRTFRRRLALTVGGKVRRENGVLKVLAECQVENLGIKRFDVSSEGTAVRLLASQVDTSSTDNPARGGWELAGVWEAFETASLELGESLEETILINIPDGGQSALRLELSVSVPSGESWRASDVVFLADERDNEDPRR